MKLLYKCCKYIFQQKVGILPLGTTCTAPLIATYSFNSLFVADFTGDLINKEEQRIYRKMHDIKNITSTWTYELSLIQSSMEKENS